MKSLLMDMKLQQQIVVRVFVFVMGLSFIFNGLACSKAQAYADFIGYGYGSCLTCHYNGQGNGPLTDYGRALWSSEIASRVFYDKKLTDEQLGERSGFLGTKEIPWWIRPSIKYRGLWYRTNPGSSAASTKYINMQLDANIALHLDQDQKYVFVFNEGYLPASSSGAEKATTISREHYFRWQVNQDFFTYVGLMDKVYGIRLIDHTAVSRAKTGLAQNDQSHGVILQYLTKPYEYTLNVFAGNLNQDADLRQKGVSVMIEKDRHQYHRIGGAVLASQNDYLQLIRAEVHSKLGFGTGNSLLAELGVIQNKPKSSDAVTGNYILLENLARIVRGYHFLSQLEYYNATMSSKSPDQLKWGFGFLIFPAPRFEVRTQLVNGRTMSDGGVSSDQWSMQGQLHVSL